MLLTFGLTLVIEGGLPPGLRHLGPVLSRAGAATRRLEPRLHVPADLPGLGDRRIGHRLLRPWWLIERTLLGANLRAATENPLLTRGLGINVPRLLTLTYGLGVALAALAGVMAAPIYQVNPLMGSNLIIVVFAVVVIGGMGSILGTIVTGYRRRRDRGPDQGRLSAGLDHHHLRDHGDGPAGAAGRPLRPYGRGAGARIRPRRARVDRRRPPGRVPSSRPAAGAGDDGTLLRLPGVPDEGALLRACSRARSTC